MLIDTRVPPPDPEPHKGWAWAVIGWVLPWPALVVWLMFAALTFDGWIGVLFSWAACVIAFWRLFSALGVGGLRDYYQ
jgi:hypothetical protein